MDEFALISRFVRCFDVDPPPRGPGDDCAVLPPSRASTCVTTDALMEDVHFTRATFTFEDIGHKALAVNLSDLAAMGARPSWFTVALALPDSVTDRQVVALGRGMAKLARTHGAKLVGGNVTSAQQLSITITVGGDLPHRPLLRSGARAGDLLFVSGPLGDAAGGLAALLSGRRAPALERAQRRPTPHLAFATRAAKLCRAAIDVSDGLLQDLGHVCAASGVGASLDSRNIPLSRALVAFAGEAGALDLALRGGEDYVLLVSAPPRHREALFALGAFELGEFTARRGLRLDGRSIGERGFTHR